VRSLFPLTARQPHVGPLLTSPPKHDGPRRTDDRGKCASRQTPPDTWPKNRSGSRHRYFRLSIFSQGRARTRTSSVPLAPVVLTRWTGPPRGPSDDAGSAAARSGAPAQDSAARRRGPRSSHSHGPDRCNDAAVHLDSYPTSLSRVRLQRVADSMLAAGMLRQPFGVQQLLMP
jgi:hypothetical protein